MNDMLVLEEVIVNDKTHSTYLYAADDECIYLNIYRQSYKLKHSEIVYIDGRGYLMFYPYEHARKGALYPISDSQIVDVNNYFIYWDKEKLKQLSLKKWNSFLMFWNYTLNFIRNNVDITNVTYKIYPTDHRMYDGDLIINFDIHLTDDYSNDYDDYFKLDELWFDGYYDLRASENDEYYWFSSIHVSFKP